LPGSRKLCKSHAPDPSYLGLTIILGPNAFGLATMLGLSAMGLTIKPGPSTYARPKRYGSGCQDSNNHARPKRTWVWMPRL